MTFRAIAAAIVNGRLAIGDWDECRGVAVPELNLLHASLWLKALVPGHGHFYSPQNYTLSAWSCMDLDSWTGKEIIAIDHKEEVKRTQDELLSYCMTSISSLVSRNNVRWWSGSQMRIYGRLLRLSSYHRVTGHSSWCLCVFVPAPILSRGFCRSSKVMISWASGGGASSPSGQLISSGNPQYISMNHNLNIEIYFWAKLKNELGQEPKEEAY